MGDMGGREKGFLSSYTALWKSIYSLPFWVFLFLFKIQLPNAISFLGAKLRFCFETWTECRANPFFSWTTHCGFRPRNARKPCSENARLGKHWTQFQSMPFPAGYTRKGFGSIWRQIKRRLLNRSTLCALHNLQRQKTGLLIRRARDSI